jgi:hypothetical protein
MISTTKFIEDLGLKSNERSKLSIFKTIQTLDNFTKYEQSNTQELIQAAIENNLINKLIQLLNDTNYKSFGTNKLIIHHTIVVQALECMTRNYTPMLDIIIEKHMKIFTNLFTLLSIEHSMYTHLAVFILFVEWSKNEIICTKLVNLQIVKIILPLYETYIKIIKFNWKKDEQKTTICTSIITYCLALLSNIAKIDSLIPHTLPSISVATNIVQTSFNTEHLLQSMSLLLSIASVEKYKNKVLAALGSFSYVMGNNHLMKENSF